MAGRMDESYYDEKKNFALEGIAMAARTIYDAAGLIEATKYGMPDLVDPQRVRDLLKEASGRLDNVRRDFEKTRWAAAATDLQFEDWLKQHGCEDLCIRSA